MLSSVAASAALFASVCEKPVLGPERPGPEPVLRVGTVPAEETVPLGLPAWGRGEVAPAAEWPSGCDLLKETDATRIVPQTSHQTAAERCPPLVDRRVVTDCFFDPAFAEYVAMRNGVVVKFYFRAYIAARGRWEGTPGDSFVAYSHFWERDVAPRFVNAVMARIA